MIQPGIHDAKRPGVKVVNAVAAMAALFDKACAPQQPQMFGNSGTGNRKGLGDATGGKTASAQQIEYGSAGGIGERAKNKLGRMCNRKVTHNA